MFFNFVLEYKIINTGVSEGRAYFKELFNRINQSDIEYNNNIKNDLAYDANKVAVDFEDSLGQYIDLLQK